ncbi:VOC family protein [Methylomonas paludis]|uniref:VOC family protein n=1 Tax=Methylomonas paludis TaxID=1173101 RepID=A0A975ML32_9GAMM|nr:VOC family protein [Methylomonas paludis]QWF69399.1 VOC family protein [Methylomonas paludis]
MNFIIFFRLVIAEYDVLAINEHSGFVRLRSYIAGFTVLIFMFVGMASSVRADDQPELSALVVGSANPEHHVGKFIFAELATSDLSKAERFYADLFGWSFREVNIAGKQYAEASIAGHPIAGLVQNSQHLPSWLSFIAVDDVEAYKTQALAHGAKLLSAPQTVPKRGQQAVFIDPQGAVFAVLAADGGDPADQLALPGEWIWSSLITGDPEGAAAFYQNLFEYEVFELAADPGTQHLLLATDNYARASVNSLPADTPNMHAHWLNYIRVDDVPGAVAKLTSLGGKVLIPPRLDRHGGKLAVVADPAGAVFGILEWPESDSKVVKQ